MSDFLNPFAEMWSEFSDVVMDAAPYVLGAGGAVLGALGGGGVGAVAGAYLGWNLGGAVRDFGKKATYDATHKQPMYNFQQEGWNIFGQSLLDNFRGTGDVIRDAVQNLGMPVK